MFQLYLDGEDPVQVLIELQYSLDESGLIIPFH